MTVTLGTIMDAQAALARLAQQPLPVSQAYRLAKLGKAVEAELQACETQRQAWVRELGHAMPDGQVQVGPERVSEFLERMTALRAETVEIAGVPVTLPPSVALSAADVAVLGPFLTFTEDD